MAKLLRTHWFLLAVVVLVAAFIVAMISPKFGSTYNIYAILQAAATLAIIGMAQMMVLGVGDMNLSISGVGSLSSVIVGAFTQDLGVPVGIAIVTATAMGLLSGAITGYIITRTGIASFIVSLAMGGILTGIALGITQSKPYPDVARLLITVGKGRFGLVPYVAIVAVIIAIIVAAFFKYARMGRHMLAVGGNAEAASLSGIRPEASRTLAYAFSGALAAIAAVMYVGVLGTASPAIGSDWLLISFAVPIIGGVSLFGGFVSVAGVLVGAVLLASVSNALISLNVSQYAVRFTQGFLIFVAVVLGTIQYQGLKKMRGNRVAERGEKANA